MKSNNSIKNIPLGINGDFKRKTEEKLLKRKNYIHK